MCGHSFAATRAGKTSEPLAAITLKDFGGGKTQLTFLQAFFLLEASRDGHAMGWNETFDNLETYLRQTPVA